MHQFIILLISRSLLFFSLFFGLNKLSNFSFPHLLLFLQMHTNTPTHKHIHTDKSIQRYACLKKNNNKKKKKKQIDTQTHPHINKPKQTNNKETDRCLSERSVLDWNDRSSWVLPDQSSWVSLDRSSWVWVLLDRS